MTMTAPTGTDLDFKVADLSLAEFGRKEIRLAEHEMPGLMELRRTTDAWLEAKAERPADVPAADWLRWEQEKHEALLAAAALTAP